MLKIMNLGSRFTRKIVGILFLVIVLAACSKTHNVTITYEANGGSMLKLSEVVNSASLQWNPIIPQKEDYRFVNWYVDAALTELYTASALEDADSLTLYAKYIEIEQTDFYLVEFSTVGGTFVPNQLVASGGLLVEPTAPVKDGYVFQYWIYVNSLSGLDGQVNFTAPITENIGLEAYYTSK